MLCPAGILTTRLLEATSPLPPAPQEAALTLHHRNTHPAASAASPALWDAHCCWFRLCGRCTGSQALMLTLTPRKQPRTRWAFRRPKHRGQTLTLGYMVRLWYQKHHPKREILHCPGWIQGKPGQDGLQAPWISPWAEVDRTRQQHLTAPCSASPFHMRKQRSGLLLRAVGTTAKGPLEKLRGFQVHKKRQKGLKAEQSHLPASGSQGSHELLQASQFCSVPLLLLVYCFPLSVY